MSHLLATTLGLTPDGFARRLRIVRPQLPPFVGHLTTSDLSVGGDRMDLALRWVDERTSVEATFIENGLEVLLVEGGAETKLQVSGG